MLGSFERFMYGENQINKKPRINWYDLATQEARNRFNKTYEELNKEEVRELVRVLSGLIPYW